MEERRSDADRQRRARRSEGDNRGCQNSEKARGSSCTGCETAPAGRAAGAAHQRRRRHAEAHDNSRGMTPILVSKVRSLQATQQASVPCQVDPTGATHVGNPTSRQSTRRVNCASAAPTHSHALGEEVGSDATVASQRVFGQSRNSHAARDVLSLAWRSLADARDPGYSWSGLILNVNWQAT